MACVSSPSRWNIRARWLDGWAGGLPPVARKQLCGAVSQQKTNICPCPEMFQCPLNPRICRQQHSLSCRKIMPAAAARHYICAQMLGYTRFPGDQL
ncbi:unnamed protein product [Gongylonema pulchrum]|uniref:Uncharacterized protein n=1 Tax=Gongylonema pulchrum TaxID=637853 RepID=A0A183DND6_9BILA|nr:unnamed protein product [Gongylonema pulchrum]